MKIILKKDVQGLGYKDEILTVKDGYGRNYLLPQRLAVLATDKAVKALNEELKQRAHKLAKIKADAEEEAKKFEGVHLTIEAKVSEGQAIYGSVGPTQIAEALGKAGIELDPKKVLTKGVKALGQYTAQIQLHREVHVEVPFEVVPDEDSKQALAEIAAQKKADKAKEAAKATETEEDAAVAAEAEAEAEVLDAMDAPAEAAE
ncbi:MAG: 50S ribosomal protein L9 [Bacteroidaceae bacterium]|nr:50S ribosomal protein L9 [Bacteroidaceae bacterium]